LRSLQTFEATLLSVCYTHLQRIFIEIRQYLTFLSRVPWSWFQIRMDK
jgi:hypothetical protein